MDRHATIPEVVIVGSHQKPRKLRNNKRRHLTKEEKDLETWKATYQMVMQSHNNYLDKSLRKLRLLKLFQYIKESLIKSKTRKRKQKIRKTSFDSLKKRWRLAREKGNEYSKLNKYNVLVIPSSFRKDSNTIKETIALQVHRARIYGNILSSLNLSKLKNSRRKFRSVEDTICSSIKLIEKRRNLLEYGSYYSMRNKLSYKDSVGQFDHEYQDLLLKCVSFEKEHIDICGFLEEKFRSNLDFRRGILALVRQQEMVPTIRVRDIPNLIPDPAKLDEHKPVASIQDTEQVLHLQKSPSSEIFNTVTKIAKPLMSAVPSDNIKSETVVHAYKYASNDHLHSSQRVQWEDQVRTTPTVVEKQALTIGSKYENENLQRISDTVRKNEHFEDTILDVMRNYRSVNEDSTEMQKLLSDLYLAFSMNLMKTAMSEKVIKEDVDMTAVRDAAVKQADAMSEVLSEIFQHKTG